MPDFTLLAERALHEEWEGQRLVRLMRLFHRFDQPLPVDLLCHVENVFPSYPADE